MKKGKECPMPRVRCTECQGYNHNTMTCKWGYIRIMPESMRHPGEDEEYNTEW